MPWVRIDEKAMEHPKVASLPDGAFRLWVQGLAHCQKYLTDGRIDRISLKALRAYSPKRVSELVAGRLWLEAEADGILVHDYLQWNESREHVLKVRAQGRERIRKLRGGNAVTPPEQSANAQRSYSGDVSCSDLPQAQVDGSEGGPGETAAKPPIVGGFSRPASYPARAHGLATLSRSHLGHAWCGERTCVPEFLHDQFVKAVGGSTADADLRRFYADTHASLREAESIEADATKFWRPRVSARWAPRQPTGKTAGNAAAVQRFAGKGGQ